MKIIRFFIGEMPIEEVEPFIEQATRYSFLDIRDPATPTHRSEFIDISFESENIDISKLVLNFKVRYEDVTGRDLISEYRRRQISF